MTRKIFLMSVFIIFTMACLGGSVLSLDPPQGSDKVDIPLFAGGKTIKMDDSDLAAFTADLFGRDYLFFESNTQVTAVERVASEIQSEMDDNLIKANWRLRSDWSGFGDFRMSQWQKGDLQLFIIVFDNLGSDDIRDLKLSYGIDNLEPGYTLTIAHVIDASQPLPDLTSTAEVENRAATGTADAYAMHSTQAAQENESAVATLSVQETLSVETTQTAVSAAQTAAVTPTATQDPHPDLELPFEDNFNEGMRPEWRIQGSGEPVLVDGKLTATSGGKVSLEIGNSTLREYTLEFDLITSGTHGKLMFYFTSVRALEINDYRMIWYEFEENAWQETSRHSTNIKWSWSSRNFRIRIVRNGDYYEIYKDGALEHTMKYGDLSGSKLIISIENNNIAIDNLIIRE